MLPKNMMLHYLERTVGKLYKILPLKESGEASIHEYLDSLRSELVGVELIEELSDQPYYVSIVGIVTYLSSYIFLKDKDFPHHN